LLESVLQVALDAAADLVGGRDEAGAGCGELGVALGVRDGDGDEFGEVLHACLGALGQRLQGSSAT
jgi:hypothetical protein